MYAPIRMYAACLEAVTIRSLRKEATDGVISLSMTENAIDLEYLRNGYKKLKDGDIREDIEIWHDLGLVYKEGDRVIFVKPPTDGVSYEPTTERIIRKTIGTVRDFVNAGQVKVLGW